MAAEDEGSRDDKPAGAERKSRTRRQRPPVTIDLTAERVAEKAGGEGAEGAGAEAPKAAAEPEKSTPAEAAPAPQQAKSATQPAAETEQTKPEAGSGPPRAKRPPGASIIGSDDGWTRPALAGVAGGIVALILIIVLQAIGLVPSPGRSAAVRAADQAKSASEAVAALEQRISAIEMITQNLPGKSSVEVLNGQVAQLQKEVGALATRADLTAVEDKLAALTSQVDALPAGATHDELAALADRVARLEAGGTGAGGGDSGASSEAVVALSHRIDTVQTNLNALGDRLAALEKTVAAGTSDNSTAARAIAIVALRRAVDEGVPFTTDLDLAAALGLPADDVAALKPFADKGVPTKAALAAAFGTVGDAIVQATTEANPDAGFFQRLLTGIGTLVTVRPSGPVAGDDPAAIVSRMRAAVEAGDFATAISERGGLPEAGKAASADWAASAESRVTIDALIAKIAQGVAPDVAPDGGNGPT